MTDGASARAPTTLIWPGVRRERYARGIPPAPTPSEAIRAVEALEQGDWRTARDLAAQLGRPGTCRPLPGAQYAGASARDGRRELASLAEAAVSRPTERWSKPADQRAGDHLALPWPAQVENEFWRRFGLVGQREEFQARSQWSRIEDSVYPKRTCLIEAARTI